jgi:hypothetical protein
MSRVFLFAKTEKLFRVLFVSPDDSRVKDLFRASQRAIPKSLSRMLLFAALPDFKQDCIGHICKVCYDDDRAALFPTAR